MKQMGQSHTDPMRFVLQASDTLLTAWSVLNQGSDFHTLFVLDAQQRLMGSVTDGDLRRAMLAGMASNSPITAAMNARVVCVNPSDNLYVPIRQWHQQGILRLPVLDASGKYINCLDTIGLQALLPFEVLILAGGKGSRLMPLTQDIPKPLLPVGGIPMIQRIIQHVSSYQPAAIHIALHHKAELIKAHCQRHAPTHIPMHFWEEPHPMGTAGALSLLNPQKPWILVINADVISDIHLEDMYLSAEEHQADILMATAQHHVALPYAVIENDAQGNVTSIREKPVVSFQINTGIYWMKSALIADLPDTPSVDMPDFIEALLKKGRVVRRFLWQGLWADIGRLEDYRAWEHTDVNSPDR